MLHRSCGAKTVSEIAVEMRNSITALAGERGWSETRERWLERAARTADISFRTARSLFYGSDHEPRASAVERVRAAVAKMDTQREAKAVDEYQILLRRIATLEAALRKTDADYNRSGVDGLRHGGGMAGGGDRPMAGALGSEPCNADC